MIIQTDSGQKLQIPDGSSPTDIDDVLQHFESTQAPSYTQNVGNDVTAAINKIGQITQKDATDPNFNPAFAGVQMLGTAAGAALSPVTEAGKSAYDILVDPQTKQAINNIGDIVGKGASGLYQEGIDKLSDTSAGQAIGDYGMKIPNLQRQAQDLSDTAKSATNLLPLPAAMEGANKAASLVGKISDKLGDASGASVNAALGGIPSAYKSLVPTVQDEPEITAANTALKTNKTAAYDNAKQLGAVLTPAASDHVGLTVPQQVENQLGVRLDSGNTYSQTKQALDNLQNKSQVGLTTNDIETTRQRLNDILSGSASGGDRAAAVIAKKSLDDVSTHLENNPNMLVGGDIRAMQAFRDARQANSVYQRHSDIADIVNDARSNPKTIQQKFQKLVSSKNENDFNRYAPDEQAIIENIAYPNGIDTKLAGSGIGSSIAHGAGVIGKGGAGMLLGGEFGHPIIGGALGAAKGAYDVLGDTLAKAKILKGSDDLLKLIASKSKPVGTPQPNAFRAKLKLPSSGTP